MWKIEIEKENREDGKTYTWEMCTASNIFHQWGVLLVVVLVGGKSAQHLFLLMDIKSNIFIYNRLNFVCRVQGKKYERQETMSDRVKATPEQYYTHAYIVLPHEN